MSKTIPLIFYSLKEQIVLPLQEKTTIKQMKEELAKKMNIKSKEFGSKIFLIYNGSKLNLTSNEKIVKTFKDNNKIFVVNKGENITIEKILSNKNQNGSSANKNNNNIIKKDDKKDNTNDNNNKDKNDNKKEDDSKVNEILEQMVILGYKEKKKIEDIKNNMKDKIINIDTCINTKDSQLLIIALLAKYLEDKIKIPTIIETPDVMLDEEEQNYGKNIIEFISNGFIVKNKYLLDFKLDNKRIDELTKDENKRKTFDANLKKVLATYYKLEEKEIIVTHFENNVDVYTSIIVFKYELSSELKKNDLEKYFKNDKELNTFTNVTKLPLIESIRLHSYMLDFRGNVSNDKAWAHNEKRGGEPYIPPIGWTKFGIRVYDRYDNNNNDWLSNGKNGWCNGYSKLHGVKNNDKNYENDDDVKHPGQKIGKGVNFYWDPKVMEKNTETIIINKNLKFKIGFMVRANPDKIRCPKSNKDILVVDGTSDDTRPYGILFKKL